MELPSTSKRTPPDKKKMSSGVTINYDLIENTSSSDLAGIEGVRVFNQSEFESGIMAQVDQAINKEKNKSEFLLKQQISRMEEDIRLAKIELEEMERDLDYKLCNAQDSDTSVQRLIRSIECQMENRVKQVASQEAKKKGLEARLLALNMPDLISAPAIDSDAVKKGAMTPFGTSSSSQPGTSGTQTTKHSKVSTTNNLKKKKKSASSTPKSNGSVTFDQLKAVKHTNHTGSFFDTHSKTGHLMRPDDANWKEAPRDPFLSDQSWSGEDARSDLDELPSTSHNSVARKRHVESESGTSCRVKLARLESSPEKRFRDDGFFDNYKSRLQRYQHRLKKDPVLREERREAMESGVGEMMTGGFSVPVWIWYRLFPYQRTCVKWLWELHTHGTGGIIGDEMGLGKTIQVIAFLAGLQDSELVDPHTDVKGMGAVLVVCPATVLEQWVREFHKWSPITRVAILHSSGSAYTKPEALVHSIAHHPGVLLTTYSTMTKHKPLLVKYRWNYVILDEGHKIKNPDAECTITCKQIRTPHRIICSGSPIQNNLKELWSLFDFVYPGRLGTLPDFLTHFAVPIVQGGYSTASPVQVESAYRCACLLRDAINPHLIRRLKADVQLQLPDKREQVLFCRLSDYQKSVYQDYLNSKECHLILEGRYLVFPGLITLRKICNHPDLCTGGPARFDPDLRLLNSEESRYGWYQRSGKMLVVDALLKLWFQQGHKVLLFSQSRAMLSIIERHVTNLDLPYLRMDGSTPISSRQRLVSQFNTTPSSSLFVFLLTTRVGGLGVNLTGADRVLIFDPDWNPSTDLQARERAWRIGQQKDVVIFRLLCTGTIEEKIYHRQIFKQFLTNRILKNPRQRRFFKANDLHELFTLKTADGARGDTETGAIFCGSGLNIHIDKSSDQRLNRFDRLRSLEKSGGTNGLKKRGAEAEDDLWDDWDDDKDEEVDVPDDLEEGEISSRSNGISVEEKRPKKRDVDLDTAQTAAEKRREQLRALAKSLSQKIGSGTLTKETSSRDLKMDISPASSDPEQKAKRSQKHKKSKKKKRRDELGVKVDGFHIAHLDRRDIYDEGHEDGMDDAPDYIVGSLVKSRGADSDDEVSKEATRVAREAQKRVDKSYRRCQDIQRTNPGLPTWTGRSGKAGKVKGEAFVDLDADVIIKTTSNEVNKKKKEPKISPKSLKAKEFTNLFGETLEKQPSKKSNQIPMTSSSMRKLSVRSLKSNGTSSMLLKTKSVPTRLSHRPTKTPASDLASLHRVLSAAGVESGLHHDKLMDDVTPDYTLIEGEADRLADALVDWLRAECCLRRGVTPIDPAMLGQCRPTFGRDKNYRLWQSTEYKSPVLSFVQQRIVDADSKSHHFDGQTSRIIHFTSNVRLSSRLLIGHIHARNAIGHSSATHKNQQPASQFLLDDATKSMAEQLRWFLAEGTVSHGEATTREIVTFFKGQIDTKYNLKFKAILRRIADFHRLGNMASMWSLKPEFIF